jgi:hypothetical protein
VDNIKNYFVVEKADENKRFNTHRFDDGCSKDI